MHTIELIHSNANWLNWWNMISGGGISLCGPYSNMVTHYMSWEAWKYWKSRGVAGVCTCNSIWFIAFISMNIYLIPYITYNPRIRLYMITLGDTHQNSRNIIFGNYIMWDWSSDLEFRFGFRGVSKEHARQPFTPNLPTKTIPTKTSWLKTSGKCPLWTWEFHPLQLRLCLSQTLWNPES